MLLGQMQQAFRSLMAGEVGDAVCCRLSNLEANGPPLPEELDSYAVKTAFLEGFRSAIAAQANWIAKLAGMNSPPEA